MNKPYQIVDIYSREDGTVFSETFTNDNRDHGYDSEDANWTLEFRSLEQAIRHHGKSRIGISGIEVTINVNGQKQ